MLRIICIMLTAMLICASLPALAEDQVIYASDFTSGTDEWYGRGSASLSVLPEGILHVSERTSDWNSPGRDFPLTEGVEYTFSVEVRQNAAPQADFMVSVAHATSEGETYENLARGTGKMGEWTRLEGTYTAGRFDRFVLYVETVGAPGLEFDIKDFVLKAPEGVQKAEAERDAIPSGRKEGEELPSLKDTYEGLFDFGAAVPSSVMMNINEMKFIKSQFAIITPENEMKPDSVLDVAASRKLSETDETAAAVKFDAVKSILNFAQKNGIKVHGHVLVWHSQTPEAFFHEGYDVKKPVVTREIMLGRLENYIKGVFEYLDVNYPGVVVTWDVVNEAIDDSTGKLRNSNWTRTIGQDFVARAFEYARKYAPADVLLFYNDYNSAMKGKLNGIVSLLESLIAEGNIDGYGFQMHHDYNYPTLVMIRDAIERVEVLGLKLRVSELDVGIPGKSEENLQKQAVFYGRLMKLLKRHSDSFIAVQVWGISDSRSWRAQKYPLLFDSRLEPKPAFWAVIDPSIVN